MASELQADKISFFRLFERFSRESVLVIMVSIAVIVATISWFRAERAIDAANLATATAETWQTMYKETEREGRLAQAQINDFRIALFKAGIEIEHTGETP